MAAIFLEVNKRIISWFVNQQISAVSYFHNWGTRFCGHANRAMVSIWLGHPRRQSSLIQQLHFRKSFCASTWTWNIFAFSRMHFSRRICKGVKTSKGTHQHPPEMWNPSHLSKKKKSLTKLLDQETFLITVIWTYFMDARNVFKMILRCFYYMDNFNMTHDNFKTTF